MIGQRVHHYEIVAKLGEGGMGIVYKARDTHLDRLVAIKVLPPEHVADPDRKARFAQEAKAASALHHPNIVVVHDIFSEAGHDFIVMEYVAGKTLDQLIPRKGMRLSEVLKSAVQIADALARAHRAGIVHRDLKPANIMVDEHGLVKVLDFGLAKLTEAGAHPDDQTRTFPLTGEHTIVGTPNYMSPEQVQGRGVEARSDIFSFGTVLYEMVTGRRAFDGDSKMATLGAIIHKEPEPLGADVPHDLDRVITRCLRKDPERRFHHMDDLKVALQELKEESESGKLVVNLGPQTPHRALRRWLVPAALLLLAVAAPLLWLAVFSRKETPAQLNAVPLTSYPGWECCPSFSPDGNQIAFVWNGEAQDNFDIYLQVIGSGKPLRITSDPAEDLSPAWSPDGRFVAFLRRTPQRSLLMMVPPLGGAERTLTVMDADIPHVGQGPLLAWTPDGKWLAYPDWSVSSQRYGVSLFSPATGEKRVLTTPPGGPFTGDLMPAFSPDGGQLSFVRRTTGGTGDLYMLALSSGPAPEGVPKRLTSDNQVMGNPVWSADGREVVYSSGERIGRSFRRLTVAGWLSGRMPGTSQGQPVAFPGDIVDTFAIQWVRHRMVYTKSAQNENIWRIDLTPGLQPPAGKPLTGSTRNEHNPAFSPDGKKVVFLSDRSGNLEVWKSDPDGSNSEQLTFLGATVTGSPRWSPDGERIVFDSNAGGRFAVYLIAAIGGTPRRLTGSDADNAVASWSRDGKSLYFVSNRTGRWQIWKMSAAGEDPVQVTQNGGHVAFESHDGKFVYYSRAFGTSPLYKIPVSGGPEIKVLDAVRPFIFTLTAKGLYFIGPPDLHGNSQIQFMDFAAGNIATVLTIDRPVQGGLTVSPDGHTILYSQTDAAESDLMLVENFR